MLARLLLTVLLVPWIASAAQGGAWPRAKGEGFFSASVTAEGPNEFGLYKHNYAIFAEYGLTPRLTFGLDFGSDALRMTKGIAFLRWPVGGDNRQIKLALEIGAGKVAGENALRPAFSVGRGIAIGARSGWINADTRAILLDDGRTNFETDLTAGLALGDQLKALVQFQAGAPEGGDDYLRIAPSLVFEVQPGTHLEIGLTEPVSGDAERGFKLGLWRKF